MTTSFELRDGWVRASAFLVIMNEVFEKFVVVGLREALALAERTFPQGAAGRSLPLDQAAAIPLKPAVSWWDGERCAFVGDVKHKRVEASGITHPDLHQLLAYTIAAGLPGGLLVYAAGEAQPTLHHVVRAVR